MRSEGMSEDTAAVGAEIQKEQQMSETGREGNPSQNSEPGVKETKRRSSRKKTEEVTTDSGSAAAAEKTLTSKTPSKSARRKASPTEEVSRQTIPMEDSATEKPKRKRRAAKENAAKGKESSAPRSAAKHAKSAASEAAPALPDQVADTEQPVAINAVQESLPISGEVQPPLPVSDSAQENLSAAMQPPLAIVSEKKAEENPLSTDKPAPVKNDRAPAASTAQIPDTTAIHSESLPSPDGTHVRTIEQSHTPEPRATSRRDLPTRPSRESQLTLAQLENMTLLDLYKLARTFNIENFRTYHKADLIWEILRARTQKDGFIFVQGLLDVVGDYGFLRPLDFQRSREDVYVSASQIRRFDLRPGDMVSGQARPPKEGERYFALLRVEAVDGISPEKSAERPDFDGLTPIFPQERFRLETNREELASRLVDIVAPIGKGQRGLIVAPPKAGKTVLLKKLANAIAQNSPEAHLIVLLIDERPEEVTDMQRSVRGEVASSTFDEPPEDHIRVAEMVLERAKRIVETGRDVVILLDSITRLARAYNLTVPVSGRTLSGGMDPAAL
ncbi:MAG: transcription termination factor Rho, partial [Firmicutes bacterium]|nr:transcription termination factor Rho [Bacillota bacterium]